MRKVKLNAWQIALVFKNGAYQRALTGTTGYGLMNRYMSMI